MRTYMKMTVATVALAVALAGNPQETRAQLADASASALGLSGNNTASVRGFAAISTNPAGLAMPGSGFSLALVPVQIRAGFGPVTLSDLAEFEGQVVPVATKEAWLTSIESNGGQSGSVGADVSALALTIGNVGFQVSTVASASMNLPVGLTEALLYGNAGRTGAATDLDLTGLGVDAFAMTTAALSYGFGLGPAKVGVTGKYTVGHGLALARTTSGSISSNPLQITLEGPAVAPCDDEVLGGCTADIANAGSGVGIDVGFMMDLPTITVGASIQNLVNSFAWDESRLSYYPGSVLIEQDSTVDNFDETPYASAPAGLREAVEGYTIKPSLRVGAAMDLPMGLTVTGDIHREFSGDDGISLGPQSHIGLGAEFTGLRILHLRAGAAKISDGTQVSGGASLVLGPVNLSAAAAIQRGDLEDAVLAQFTLSIGGR